MKLVDGGQLDDVVRREPMTSGAPVELIAKVARIVHTHRDRILHRDIKPGTILLDQTKVNHTLPILACELVET